MLVLTRKKNEVIVINGEIEIKVVDIKKGEVKIGIVAPENMSIYREEVYKKILEENKKAALSKHKDDLKKINQQLIKKIKKK